MELSALEIRIVRFLGENYPVTVVELRKALSVRQDTLTRTLKSLVVKGVIELEPLPDKTYVRLLAPGIVSEPSPSSTPTDGGGEASDDDSFMYM